MLFSDQMMTTRFSQPLTEKQGVTKTIMDLNCFHNFNIVLRKVIMCTFRCTELFIMCRFSSKGLVILSAFDMELLLTVIKIVFLCWAYICVYCTAMCFEVVQSIFCWSSKYHNKLTFDHKNVTYKWWQRLKTSHENCFETNIGYYGLDTVEYYLDLRLRSNR